MLNSKAKKTSPKRKEKGFNVTEVTVTTAMVALLGSIAYPSYLDGKDRAQCSEAKATLVSIPPIISAYINETGEAPITWEQLSSIAVVMTSDGTATGAFEETPIKLPTTNYELSIEGPSESVYSLSANCFIKTTTDDLETTQEDPDKDKYVIRSCFNVNSGASDLTTGSGTDPENTPNCG